jgi:hypothetical protein
MGLFKEEQRELLRIRGALSAIGYYAACVEKRLGDNKAVIHVTACEPGAHDTEIQNDLRFLESIPDHAAGDEYARFSQRPRSRQEHF